MVDPKSKEREKQSRYKYTSEIQQMMFVFGEVADPLPETTMLVEDIVRSQVIEIIILAAAQAQKRGSKNMNAEDLIFLIRRDRAKVNRLRTYLSWKDIRKNVKDSGGNDAAEEMLEDPNTGDSADKPKAKRMNVKLSWELASSFLDALNDDDDENDEDEREAYADTLQRLKDADEITRAMTRDEYVHYSECRQASFTYRKAKRFREWANMAAYIDIKPNDDIIDILGFLTFEMVNTLTETALYIKHDNDLKEKMDGKKVNLPREPEGFLFSPPPSEQTPLQPQHIHEAFRRLQRTPQPIKNFRGGLARTKVSLI